MRDDGELPPGEEASTSALAQRIERLAQTARQAAVAPIAALAHVLQDELLAADATLLLRALQDMHHAVREAHCETRRPRWLQWLGWLGRGQAAALRFQAHCREAV